MIACFRIFSWNRHPVHITVMSIIFTMCSMLVALCQHKIILVNICILAERFLGLYGSILHPVIFEHCIILISSIEFLISHSPVSWGCRIRRLYLCRQVNPSTLNECPGNDTKPSDLRLQSWRFGEYGVPLHCYYWPKVAVPVRVPYMGQIDLFNLFFIRDY